MKSPKVVAILLVIVVLLVGIFFVLNKSDGPEKTISKLEAALNVADIEKVLECIDPKVARPMLSLMNVASDLMGVELNDVITMLPMFAGLTYDYAGIDSEMPQVDIEVTDVQIDGDTALVDLTWTSIADGVSTVDYLEDTALIKVDGKWYLDVDTSW